MIEVCKRLIRSSGRTDWCFCGLVVIGVWVCQACGSGIIGWRVKTLGDGARLEVVSRRDTGRAGRVLVL